MRISRLASVLAFGWLACVPSNPPTSGTGDQCVTTGNCSSSSSASSSSSSSESSSSSGSSSSSSSGGGQNTSTASATKTDSTTGTKTATTVVQSATATATATVTKAPASPNCTDVSYTAPYTLSNAGGVTRLTTPEGKEYLLQANWWHKYDGQTEAIDGLSWKMGNPKGTSSSDDNPAGYPSMFIGAYQGRTTAKSNLPIQVSAIKSVNTIFSTNANSKGTSNYNVAYDVWFTPTGTPLDKSAVAPPSGGAYLMVWYFKPSNRQPRGSNEHPGHTVSGVSGSWDVWIDHSNPPCISYVSKNNIETLDFDLNKFIQDAANNNYGASDWKSKYLSVVFAGFEVWGGGDGLQAKAFCANVQ